MQVQFSMAVEEMRFESNLKSQTTQAKRNSPEITGLLSKSTQNNRILGESGAGNETRTRDPNLGKVVLYQLSYSRKMASRRGFEPLLPP